jgi:hypothetical protein
MSFFDTLNKEELQDVADYFVVDVEAADPEKGPSKKELVASLAAGTEPVTREDYENLFLPNRDKFNADKAEAEEAEKAAREEAEKAQNTPDADVVEAVKSEVATPAVKSDDNNYMVVKYTRKNPRYDIVGLTFTKAHPYRRVHSDTAAWLIRTQEGFSLALPEEVAEYYGSSRV